MGLATRVCAIVVLATMPVSARDVNDALLSMCEGVEPYDPADVEAVRENADDFCAVLLSEPHKARRQLGKMLVRNRAASNANRWYIDARRIPSRHRHRYDGAYVQLRRPWMGDDWAIDWAPCFDLYRPPVDQVADMQFEQNREGFLTWHHNNHCFRFAQYDDAGDVLASFILWIHWVDGQWVDGQIHEDDPRWHLEVATKDAYRLGWQCRVTVDPYDLEHGLNLIDDMLDTLPTYGCQGRVLPR